jgi:protein-L-isoaspartate(D-aspartate) O-methyltransferase
VGLLLFAAGHDGHHAEQLQPQAGDKLLEIGAGTGFNAALLAHLVGEGGQVTSIDIAPDVAEAARRHLDAAGFHWVRVICADGGYGWPQGAPYDRIILTVGSAEISPAWFEQLRPGGMLVMPLEAPGGQKSVAFVKQEGYLESRSTSDCGFMTLQGDFSGPEETRLELGPQGGVFLSTGAGQPTDPQAAFAALNRPGASVNSGARVTLREVLRSLRFWLWLHSPLACSLAALGQRVELELVPPLLAAGGEFRSSNTYGLAEGESLALLTRPPGEPAPLADLDDLYREDAPFHLHVQGFGPETEARRLQDRLLAEIRAWAAAGRPATDNLGLRAYPKDAAYSPGAGEILLPRQYFDLVITL